MSLWSIRLRIPKELAKAVLNFAFFPVLAWSFCDNFISSRGRDYTLQQAIRLAGVFD
jgi:hypothetical protein